MKVTGIIWLRDVVDKLSWKHNITTDEVEEIFDSSPRSGRYVIVYFVHKKTGEALIVSARDMTRKERRTYGK
ncbi:MAG: BrnT family toxin [Chloroflexi bacterium]|nr:BrnT family toxin [Chloroflexota bacterium]